MLINKLYINDDIFCDFHKGLNIIIAFNHQSTDESGNSTIDTNGVGKSLIVNLIKKILGGDTETIFNSQYYERKSVFASLEINIKADEYYVVGYSFAKNLSDYKIVYKGNFKSYKKEIIDNGLFDIKAPFDYYEKFNENPNIKLNNKKEFTSFINQIEDIDYHSANITFNALLDFIVRDEKNGFSDIISRIRRSQRVQYRSIQYLFNMPYNVEEKIFNITQKISDYKVEIESKEKALKKDGIKSISNIENQRIKINRELRSILNDKETLRSSKSIESIRKAYKAIKQKLVKMNNSINEKEHQITNYKLNLENIKEKEADLSNFLDVEDFYNDMIGVFPESIKVNFKEYKSFINSISKDRSEYLNNAIFETENKLKEIKKRKTIIQKELDDTSKKLNSFEIVDDIAVIGQREEEANEKLSRLDKYEIDFQEIDTLSETNEKLENDRRTILKQTKNTEKAKNSRKERKDIIEFFQGLILEVYQKPDCYLNFELNSDIKSSICGRTEIECSIPSDKSHGRTNAKICLFDLTWFLSDNSLYNPQFLIHDGPYSKISKEVKHRILQLVIKYLENVEKQYIITINESELPYLDKYKQYFSKELNGNNISGKFFGEQFDE